MIEVVPFEKEHLEKIRPRSVFDLDTTLQKRVQWISDDPGTFIFTMKDDKDIYAILGGTILYDGVAEIWSVTSELVTKKPVFFIKAARKLLDHCKEKFKIIRYYMIVSSNLPCGRRFAESLGFSLEAILRKHAPGGIDAFMFGRV